MGKSFTVWLWGCITETKTYMLGAISGVILTLMADSFLEVSTHHDLMILLFFSMLIKALALAAPGKLTMAVSPML